MSRGYRFEWRWLLMGPLLGLFCGSVTGTLVVGVPLLLVSPLGALVVALPAGVLLGGPVGTAVGAVAGVPLAFLVGPHLAPASAALRARLLGAALPPLVLLAAATWLPTSSWFGSWVGPTLTWLGTCPYLAAAFLGGVTAEITARVDMPRQVVS